MHERSPRPHRRRLAIACIAALLAAATLRPTPASATPTYTFLNFDVAGAHYVRTTGINDSGQVVGYSYGSTFLDQGFLRNPVTGAITALPNPVGTYQNEATGINNAGQIVGTAYSASTGASSFLRDPSTGAYTTLTSPANTSIRASGINNKGEIVGTYYHPNTINGFERSSTGTIATLFLQATGINDSDQIVGFYQDANYNLYGYLLSNFADVTALASGAIPYGINDAGQIVGMRNNDGFVRDPVSGAYTLIDDPAATTQFTIATGINNLGQIVGTYYDSTGYHGFIATPDQVTAVPEPASLVMIGAALLGVAAHRRRIRAPRSSSRGGATCILVAMAACAPAAARATPTYTYLNFDVTGAFVTEAFGINDAGQVVGSDRTRDDGQSGFVRNPDGSITTTAQPVANRPFAFALSGIDNAGRYVGYGSFGFLYDPASSTLTTLQDPIGDSGYTTPGGINNSGQITGYYISGQTQNGFLRDPLTGNYVTLTDPEGTATLSFGINDAGTIVGLYRNDSGTHGFVRHTDGSYSNLGTSTAYGINNAGQIVGAGFVLDPVTGITFLSDPAAAFGDTVATGINNLGQIVGYYQDQTGTHGFIATPDQVTAVPEPGTLLLVTTGLLPATLAGRRRP